MVVWWRKGNEGDRRTFIFIFFEKNGEPAASVSGLLYFLVSISPPNGFAWDI